MTGTHDRRPVRAPLRQAALALFLLSSTGAPPARATADEPVAPAPSVRAAADEPAAPASAIRDEAGLFTDKGRAINQQEPGWETTLTGLPQELYKFWKQHLQPRGYRLKFQIADWPNGMPGDISLTLSWGER